MEDLFETEEYHLKEFEEIIQNEIKKYNERTGAKYESLYEFYHDCQDCLIEAAYLTDLPKLLEVLKDANDLKLI